MAAKVLGHASDPMVRKVYGDPSTAKLERRMPDRRGHGLWDVVGTDGTPWMDWTELPYRNALKEAFFGAQRRSRTADTGIFNPLRADAGAAENKGAREQRRASPSGCAAREIGPRGRGARDGGRDQGGSLGGADPAQVTPVCPPPELVHY